MTKIRVTKRAFPRRITYTHLVRPLMRHSSRIKLFTRNWPKSHFFHPLSFVPPPPSNTTPSRKGKKEKDRRNFPGETNGSSRRNSSKKSPNLFRIYSARKGFAQSLKNPSSRRFPRNDSFEKGCETRREIVVLIRSPKTFPLDDRLFSTRRDSARFLHPWRSWRIEGGKRGHWGLSARQGMLWDGRGTGNELTGCIHAVFFRDIVSFLSPGFCFLFSFVERNDSFFGAICLKRRMSTWCLERETIRFTGEFFSSWR